MSKLIDMTGWVMREHGIEDSRITIIKEDKDYCLRNSIKYKKTYWFCLCDCGNTFSAKGSDIKRGAVKSCGCLQKEKVSKLNKKELLNQVFGKLKVLEEDKDYSLKYNIKTKEIFWKCQCECGNVVSVSGNKLRSGVTQSCGCLRSKGEFKIIQLLTKKSIPFETQKTFSNCRFISGYPAKFDFWINEEFLLEFDGEQHFNSRKSGWSSEEKVSLTKERDKYKNQWCKENNIPLKRIPYWALDNLTIEDILSDKYLIKEEEENV